MNQTFKDHFSDKSDDYSKFRPQYPIALFNYLSSVTAHHESAWDCATGSGQATLGLSHHFTNIIATDASESQIENVIKQSGIEYRVATAEKSRIKSNTVDLITVAQAFHWFNHGAFFKEVDRVLKPDGLLSIWTYNLLSIQDGIDKIINHLYESVLGDYWPKEREMVENGYQDIHVPMEEITTPKFQMSSEWNLDQLMGYLGTWSAVRKYQKITGVNPLEKTYEVLLTLWGDPENTKAVSWPLNVRLWKPHR